MAGFHESAEDDAVTTRAVAQALLHELVLG